jgi:GntR family transcriptional regulator
VPRPSIVAVAEQPAPPHVAQALGIGPGAPVVRLERVRLGGDEPMTLEDTWVPAERFPGLLGHDLGGSLYALMRDRYGLAPVSATERLEPVAARAHEAAELGIAEGSPLMLVVRVAYAEDGTAVEYSHDRHRGDRARFVIRVVPDTLLARAR